MTGSARLQMQLRCEVRHLFVDVAVVEPASVALCVRVHITCVRAVLVYASYAHTSEVYTSSGQRTLSAVQRR